MVAAIGAVTHLPIPPNEVNNGTDGPASKKKQTGPVESKLPRNPAAAARFERRARRIATNELTPVAAIAALLNPPEVAPAALLNPPAAAPKKITLRSAVDNVTARVKALFPFGRNPAAIPAVIPAGPAVPAPAAPAGAARGKPTSIANRVKNFTKVLGSFGWRQAATPKPAEKTINPILLQDIKNKTQIETAFKNYETAINECDSFVRVQMKEKTTFYTRFSCRKKPPKLSPQEFIAKYNSLMEERVKAKSKASDALDAAYTIVNSLRNSVKPLAKSYCDEQFKAKLNKLNELNEKFIQFLNSPKFIFKYARITANAYKIALEEQEKFLNDPKLGEIENCTQGFKRAVFGGEKPVSHEELRRKFEKLQENRLNAKFNAEDAFSLGEELLSIKGKGPSNIKQTQDLKELDQNFKLHRQELAKWVAKSAKSEMSLATLASIKEKKLTRLSDLEDRVKRDIEIHLPKISEETPGFVTKVQTDEAGAHIAKVTERLTKVTERLDNNKQQTKEELKEKLTKLENATRKYTGTVLLNTPALTNAPAAAAPTSTRVFTKYNPGYLSAKMAGYSMLGASSAAAISNMLGVDPSSTGSVIGNTLHSAATSTLTSAPNALRQAGNFASTVASGVSYGLQTAADNKVSRAVYAAAEKVVEATGNDPSDEFVQGGLMTVPVLGKVLLTEVVARKTKAHLGSAAATVVRGVGYTAAAAPVVKMGFDKFAPQLKVAEQAGAIYSSLPTIETPSWLPSTEGIGTAISTHGGAVMGAVSSALLVKSAAATLDDLNLPTAAKATRVVGYTASAAPLIESIATSMGVTQVVASNLSEASAAVRNIVSSLPDPLAVLPSVDTVLNTVTTGATLGGALVVAEGTRRWANALEAAGFNLVASKIRLGGYGASFLASAKVYADLTGVTSLVTNALNSSGVKDVLANGFTKAASYWQSFTQATPPAPAFGAPSAFLDATTAAANTASSYIPQIQAAATSFLNATTAAANTASSYIPQMKVAAISAAEAVVAHPYVAAGVLATAATAGLVYKCTPKGTIPAVFKWVNAHRRTVLLGGAALGTMAVLGAPAAIGLLGGSLLAAVKNN